jgi:hypothetical protein
VNTHKIRAPHCLPSAARTTAAAFSYGSGRCPRWETARVREMGCGWLVNPPRFSSSFMWLHQPVYVYQWIVAKEESKLVIDISI